MLCSWGGAFHRPHVDEARKAHMLAQLGAPNPAQSQSVMSAEEEYFNLYFQVNSSLHFYVVSSRHRIHRACRLSIDHRRYINLSIYGGILT